ncbi:MAG: 30S ribosome-binding factor RbfA [Burkholderia sp.]|nr:30S ribosome-binding factor RbfA [Burkholderia sp.]
MKKKSTPSNRNAKISSQIQRDLSELIIREIKDPRIGIVTLESVEITPNYEHANIYFTLLTGEKKDTQDALNHASGHLRNLLFKLLHIHTVPSLHFYYDQTTERAYKISHLIDEANLRNIEKDD